MSDEWEIIHTYSRADAIRDGALVDVTSKMTREAGFKIPVAMTAAVYEDCVRWDESDPRAQDEEGRLWDVLSMAMIAARRERDAQRVIFEVLRIDRHGYGETPGLVTLVMAVGPGDEGEPVITIMKPGED